MAKSEICCHDESYQYQYYISTGHRLCPIIMKLALYDLQTKPNKSAKQPLFFSKPFGRDSQSNLTAKPGRHVESGQYKHYISTGHKLCPIIMNLAICDHQTKLNKRAKVLVQILNLLAVTANQT